MWKNLVCTNMELWSEAPTLFIWSKYNTRRVFHSLKVAQSWVSAVAFPQTVISWLTVKLTSRRSHKTQRQWGEIISEWCPYFHHHNEMTVRGKKTKQNTHTHKRGFGFYFQFFPHRPDVFCATFYGVAVVCEAAAAAADCGEPPLVAALVSAALWLIPLLFSWNLAPLRRSLDGCLRWRRG